MEALFLYLDEELTNKRPGRIPGNYTVEDLAFWLQFYSLFYDSVFVPANFLTDSNLVPAILERLDVSNPTATLHAEDGPFKILWDTSRFPCDSFKELVHFLKTDESYVSLRDNELSSITAELCDKYLKHRIIRADMTAHLDPLESVEQLRNEVFNPSRNWALEQHILERLAECLEKIVDRREQVGYGRNFYYTLFGYGRTTEQQQLAQKFADIIGKYESLKHEFLTGVDYVSHRLKARFASRAINRPIEVLMPPEFLSIICRPDKAATLATGLGRTERVKLSAEEKYQRLIVRETITGMSASQLAELHKSREYQEYRDTWHELRKQFYDPEDQRGGEDLEQALNTYLDRITTTLNPKRHYADRTTSMVVKRIPTLAGLSVTLVLEFLGSIAGSPKLSDSARELVSEGVELFSTYAGSTVVKMTTGRRSLPFHSFQLAEDITVYLGKN
jgi:hypothetical protein